MAFYHTAMFERIRADFRRFVKDAPGTRFARRYAQRRDAAMAWWQRAAWLLAGLFFVLAGFVMLFTPGPGLLAIGFGLTCLAQESLRLARWCDRVEMRLRAAWTRWRARR